ncbi:MAG: tRNA (guanine-N7-)-methyltransferase [Thermotogaceae bacterium]|jgi:tRNA (guanine-N7-)-methyltransferase|nr:tRNA (guanine-N7-)-methyltransferase [Thermotogaceae bacterium]
MNSAASINNAFDYIVKAHLYDQYPLDWQTIFGNQQPLTVEIGFGNGEYTLELARKHPDRNFVGFETSQSSVSKTLRRMFKEGLTNVRIVMTDGRFGLRNLFDDESVECVILNFPTPWSKGRHFRRRVAVTDFFRTLQLVLTPNGRLELATDVLNYAVDVYKMSKTLGFEPEEMVINGPREIMTRFERKWRHYERNIHTLTVYRGNNEKCDRLLERSVVMPHEKLLETEASIENLYSGLNQSHKSPSGNEICVYKVIYEGREKDTFLIKTIAVDMYDHGEGEFEQHYFIDIYKNNRQWLLKLDPISRPFITPAVKFSIRSLAKTLKKQ